METEDIRRKLMNSKEELEVPALPDSATELLGPHRSTEASIVAEEGLPRVLSVLRYL